MGIKSCGRIPMARPLTTAGAPHRSAAMVLNEQRLLRMTACQREFSTTGVVDLHTAHGREAIEGIKQPGHASNVSMPLG